MVMHKTKTPYRRMAHPHCVPNETDEKSRLKGVMGATCEPRREKTGLRGFRPGPTQTGLYKLRKELEA